VTVFELRDPVSSASHLVTAVWAVFAGMLMLRLTPKDRRVPVAVFAFSMVFLYTASGLFHGIHFTSPEQRRFFQRLDHTGIYILIAGTYTPVLAILLRGAWRRWLLRGMWLLAGVGVATMWLFPKPPHELNVGIYLGMGWIGVIALPLYYKAVGWRAMNWALLGAILYTVGTICELCEWPVVVPGLVGYHEVFHFFDSAATLAFFVFVFRYVIPYQPPAAPVPAPHAERLTGRSSGNVPTPRSGIRI
jgi:hemolysin III